MKLNHVVLFVRDLPKMADFYQRVLGLEVAEKIGENAIFFRIPSGGNHHDLALISAGSDAKLPGDGPRTGLYHIAWELKTFENLLEAREDLAQSGALVGESEHGNSLSLYSKDPEGNEFEVFWMLPESEWKKRGFGIRALDLEKEKVKWSKS